MKRMLMILLGVSLVLSIAAQQHPCLYATEKDKPAILQKIKNEKWAADAFSKLKKDIDKYVDRHITDSTWIISRLAMYWKDGEHYTQCYIKKENWDYGEGNAPVPTVRLPGMRVWNAFSNVSLEDREPYNVTGDMKGTNKADPKAGVVLVPYKQSGHMIRGNNNEILTLAEKAAFAYWINGEEKYAKFAADIFNTWLAGTYYMNPPYDPSKMKNGYEAGGIFGYYDYEQIHDDLQTHAAAIYDFLYDYLTTRPTTAIKETGKSYSEIASTVFKRFIDIGIVRGGKKGNWNINGWEMMMPSILVLDSSNVYADKKGKDYYIPFYTTTSTNYHDALPDILKGFDPVTGLWPESPGYALNTVPSLLNIATMLYKSGTNTIEGNPVMQKAAMAVFPWLDARGNIMNFGDGRGGPGNFEAFERLLTYYTLENEKENVSVVSAALQKGINEKQYNRSNSGWKDICSNVSTLLSTGKSIPYARVAYSPVHRHIVMKNGNDVENGLMFTLYGGYPKQKHLSPNGLALQLYGKGWALAPDASGYESYWSADYAYHQTATGSNTIMPGYTDGEIVSNAMEPSLSPEEFITSKAISPYVSFADVSAGEKRRMVAMIRTSASSGYYIDIFRSNQNNNDYIYHNLGNTLLLTDKSGKELALKPDSFEVKYPAYNYFRNPKKILMPDDFFATWTINAVTPNISMNMWMKGEAGREIFKVDAPYTNTKNEVAPAKVNISPDSTPSIIVRQNNANGFNKPFVAVFEPYSDNKRSIRKISALPCDTGTTVLQIESNSLNADLEGKKDLIMYTLNDKVVQPRSDISFNGSFGVVSENKQGLHYLYLGNGKSISFKEYSISSEKNIAAGLIIKADSFIYSSSGNVTISLPCKNKAGKKYIIWYKIAGSLIEVPGNYNSAKQTVSGLLPAGNNVEIKILESNKN